MDRYELLINGGAPYFNTIAQAKWADLGCGTGVFTKALASFLPNGSTILAVDKEPQYLPVSMGDGIKTEFQRADFTVEPLKTGPLNGILMANSLHYVHDKLALIRRLEAHLAPGAHWLIVEYDNRKPNRWVPYPIDFRTLSELFRSLGYEQIEKIGEQSSAYGGSMYAVVIFKP